MRENIVQLLKQWKTNLATDISIGTIYLFGSLINDDGLLFDARTSDVDLIVLIPDNLVSAVERTKWLTTLKEHKLKLEIELISLLKRTNNSKAIVSVVTISKQELLGNIHKSSVRDFFIGTNFYDIDNDKTIDGLIDAVSVTPIGDLHRQIYEFVQSVRNKFLSIYLGQARHTLDWDSKDDVIPKEIIRTCSIVAFIENGQINKGEKTDIKIGLSHLEYYIYSKRNVDSTYLNIYNWLSKRKLRKGDEQGLGHIEYLFLAEMIFDMAYSLNIEKIYEANRIDTHFEVDFKNAVLSEFKITRDGVITGTHDDISREIINAKVNLAWKTKPFFRIVLEEMNVLSAVIEKDNRNGQAVMRLRELGVIHDDLIKAFTFIIYFQNYLFRKSSDEVSDILLSLQGYVHLRNSHFSLDEMFEMIGYPLEAYHVDHKELRSQFPEIGLKLIIQFEIPNEEMKSFFAKHERFRKLDEGAQPMELAAQNEPLLSIKHTLIAQYFIPELINKMVRAGLDPLSEDEAISKLNARITDLRLWKVGIS